MSKGCPQCGDGRQHFGHCHKCPHDAEVKAGKYIDMRADKVPCFTCRLPVETRVSGHGTLVPLDESFHETAQPEYVPSSDHMDAFVRVLNELWTFPYLTREIVARRLQGHRWEDIASALNLKHNAGLTLQACHLRLKAAIDRSDSLRILFAAMVIKQQRRDDNAE